MVTMTSFENYRLNEQTAKNIRGYIPIDEKQQQIEYMKNAMIMRDKNTGLFFQNGYAKEMLLTAVYLEEYMRIECGIQSDNGKREFTCMQYDKVMQSGVIQYLESIRHGKDTSPDIKRKLWRVQSDFELLKRLLQSDVCNTLATLNDTTTRLVEKISADISPEKLQKSFDELERLPKEAEKARQEHECIIKSFPEKKADK